MRQALLQLPLGAIIDDRIFVVHAGIPTKEFYLDDLRHYKRGEDYDRESVEGLLFRSSVWTVPYSASEESDGDDYGNGNENNVEGFKLDPDNDDGRGWFTAYQDFPDKA